MSRPEFSNPPELFYNETEAKKYDSSSRNMKIQEELTLRALEMLALPEGKRAYILDIGCGSGLSGQVLEEAGHYWVGCDISESMLAIAADQDSETGDIIHADMGQGLPFRPASFDGAISISALQWLCYSNSSDQDPRLRINRFFSSLYTVLKRDAKAILQFYPESPEQAVLIAQAASRVGFSGGLVVDYPNSSKAKKHFLCLSFERSYTLPSSVEHGHGKQRGSTEEGAASGLSVIGRSNANNTSSANGHRSKNNHHKAHKATGGRPKVKSVQWIKDKKESQRAKGKQVKSDSKFTGRKRPTPF